MMKKWLCLIILLTVCLYASAALATDIDGRYGSVTSGDWVYLITKDGNAALIGYFGGDTSVTVPAEIDGIPVTDLYNTFAWFYTTMSDGQLLDLPYHEAVREYANWISTKNEYSIEEVIVPDGVPVVAVGPFNLGAYQARGSVYMSSTIAYLTIPEGVTRIERMNLGSELMGVSLPSTLEVIGDEAFMDCISLTSIEIPEGVTTIGDSAFRSCNALREIRLPSTLKTIGSGAFTSCTSLTEISLPEGITAISALEGCTALSSVTLPAGVESVSSSAFSSTTKVIQP